MIMLMLFGCTSKKDTESVDDHLYETIPDNKTEVDNETTQNNTTEKQMQDDVSVTKDKKVIFFGDSIVRGVKPDRYSWATYIGNNYDLLESVNAGIGDYRVSTYDDPNKWLVDEVKEYIGNDYDYVILEGGINDVFYDTPIGEAGSYDEKTFIGGLESYLKIVDDNWPDAKIGYIITYYAPNYTERGLKWSVEDYKKYYDITKEVLDSYGIEYLDLSDDFFMDMIDVNSTTYLSDYLHPNYNGYDLLSPYIYKWMSKLK